MKKAVRVISFKPFDYPTADLFKDLNILPLDKSIKLKYGKFMWRLKNGYLPDNLTKDYHINVRNGFSSSLSRLESLKDFILFAGPGLWNELPSVITSKPSLDSFSRALKNHLIWTNPVFHSPTLNNKSYVWIMLTNLSIHNIFIGHNLHLHHHHYL